MKMETDTISWMANHPFFPSWDIYRIYNEGRKKEGWRIKPGTKRRTVLRFSFRFGLKWWHVIDIERPEPVSHELILDNKAEGDDMRYDFHLRSRNDDQFHYSTWGTRNGQQEAFRAAFIWGKANGWDGSGHEDSKLWKDLP